MTLDRETMRNRYGSAAGSSEDPMIKVGGTCGATYYDSGDLEALPGQLIQTGLGCANPLALADLREGETILDLGSGGGIDVLLSATRVDFRQGSTPTMSGAQFPMPATLSAGRVSVRAAARGRGRP